MTEQVRQHVGGYRLLHRIGEGGMGVVHLAEAADGSRVALKVLRQHVIGDDEARERLSREVASLRRVTSPRIAQVIDADPWGETPYVATRYVPGLSLHEHVRQHGPITGVDLAHLATGLAEAVIAVHQVGVLHRDIKPSNVLLEGRAPVLIDFGLARLAEDPRLTHTGWLLGTPGYLAPEILYGDDASTASDVHSWAATIAFACTGAPPFGTGPAMAVMDRVRRGEHDLSLVPRAVLPLVRACLAADPADRPSTATVLSTLRQSAPSAASAAGRRPAPVVRDQPTLPLALARPDDPDATDLLGTAVRPKPGPAAPEATPVTAQLARPVRAPVAGPAPAPVAGPVQGPVQGPVAGPDAGPVREHRLRRTALVLALFAAVTLGFARAPYLSLAAVAPLTLAVRTVSWTSDAARARRQERGRRWYDAPLIVLSSPWYLLVATAGTLLLLVWAALVGFLAGFAYLLFRGPLVPGLLLTGAVVALALWWGPGSRRVRVPVRRLARGADRHAWPAWLGVAVVVAVAGLLAAGLQADGVLWAPDVGSPWRPGTLLGTVLGWF